MKEELIPIIEIFGPTIQGEGFLIGSPSIFIRSAKCDNRCSYCDTKYAWDEPVGCRMTPTDIVRAVCELSREPILVTITGGNPAMYDFRTVVDMLDVFGHYTAVETQGTIYREWFNFVHVLMLSPKPPSSGNPPIDHEVFKQCAESTATVKKLKVVVDTEEDLDFAVDLAKKYNLDISVQPCNHNTERFDYQEYISVYNSLVEMVKRKKHFHVKVLPQLHVMIWGNKRGV